MEKAYLTMKNSGASSITIWDYRSLSEWQQEYFAIVNGAKLLKHKKEITF